MTEILDKVAILSIVNFVVLSIVLIFKKGPNPTANKILFCLYCTILLYCGLVYFHFSAIEFEHFYLLKYYTPIDGIVLMATAPLMYFYIMAVINHPVWKSKVERFLHLIPLIPYIIFNIHFGLLPLTERLDWLVSDFSFGTIEMKWLNTLIYTQVLSYLIMSYFKAKKHLKHSNEIHLNGAMYNVGWVITYLRINIIFIGLTAPVCFYFDNEKVSIFIGMLIMDVQFLFMFVKWSLFADTGREVVEKGNNRKNKSNPVIVEEDLNRLVEHMIQQKPYLEENCTVQTISDAIGISAYKLSMIVNANFQKNFSDYINEYRIETAKELLKKLKDEKTTIESIAHDCGFSSKSPFNRAFKKYCNNLTPSQYLQQLESESDSVNC